VPDRQRTTVFLADDHPVYREGLRRAVEERPELRLVGEAADGRQTVSELRRLRPDVAVVDLRMPELEGAELVAAVKAAAPDTRVLVLSAFDDAEHVFAALTAGADGYLAKDADREAICDGIAALARGEALIDPGVQSGLLREMRSRAAARKPTLTPREHDVLELVAEGLTAQQIGDRLVLSAATVKTHLSSVYEKLGVPDRSSAVAVAMRRGLLD
jgi:two-component system nitrate/nitrite response regulator NarL